MEGVLCHRIDEKETASCGKEGSHAQSRVGKSRVLRKQRGRGTRRQDVDVTGACVAREQSTECEGTREKSGDSLGSDRKGEVGGIGGRGSRAEGKTTRGS